MISLPMHEDFTSLAKEVGLYEILQGKRVYLTGATGQIGWYLTHLVSHLIEQGHLHCDLTAHVRDTVKLRKKYPGHSAMHCKFIVDDDAARPLANETFDLVIHCASKASPRHFNAKPVDVMIPNAILAHDMLEQIRRHNTRTLFVYLSTTGVTGFIPDEQRPSSETDHGPLSCTDLGNCYLESKRFGEMLCLAYCKQYGIPILIVRPSITYGPGFDLDDGRSYADFVRCLLKNQPIKLTSDGSAIRNFLYITDFIKGLFTVIANAPVGSVVNIASPNPIKILDLATLLNTSLYSKSLGDVEHASDANGQYTRVNFKSTDASVDRLRSYGWQQETSILDGFRKTIRHYEECPE